MGYWKNKPTYRNKQDDSLNRMVEAIREMLGLSPLYKKDLPDSKLPKNERVSVHIFQDRNGMTPRRSGHH